MTSPQRKPSVVIVDLHPEMVYGGCEAVLRAWSRTARDRANVSWFGASFEFYTFLRFVYRALGMRAAELKLVSEELSNVRVERFRFITLVPFTAPWRRARRLLRDADAIYAKNEFLELSILAWLGGRPAYAKTTIGLHTPIDLRNAPATRWRKIHDFLYANALYRSFLREARSIHSVAPLEATGLGFVFGGRVPPDVTKKIVVVPNGILPGALAAYRASNGYLAVGRLSDQKGLDRLGKVLSDEVVATLTVIGDGDQLPYLRTALPRATFIGMREHDDVLQAFSRHAVFLMPSRWENHPLTLLEAMAAGCIPIVSELATLRETLPPGLCWLAVDYDDPSAFVRCLTKVKSVLADATEHEALRVRLHRHVTERFDRDRQNRALLEAVLASSRSTGSRMNDTRHWYEDFYATAPPAESAWYRAIERWLTEHPDVEGPLLELGCGRAALLSRLAQSRRITADQLHGLEQSATAIESARALLPYVKTGDIESTLPYDDGSMNVIVLAEVIEHLRDPDRVLGEVRRVLATGGRFVVTFPNYINLPWLGIRLLAAALNKPNWIVLQPVDHIFFYPALRARIAKHGFRHVETAGTIFGPPILYRYESDSLARRLTKAGLAALSFHPMLVFKRT